MENIASALQGGNVKTAILGVGAAGAASFFVFSMASSVLGSRKATNSHERAEERAWLSQIVGDRDASAIFADDTLKGCSYKLRMYRHFNAKAYDGLMKSLAAVVRFKRHVHIRQDYQGSPGRTLTRYLGGARKALEDLMETLKARDGDPAQNGYDDAAEIAEMLTEYFDSTFSEVMWDAEKNKLM